MHASQAFLKLRIPTRSPIFHASGSHWEPTAAMTPAGSWEGMSGRGDENWPLSVCASEWQKPAAWISTRSSVGLICGTGTVRSW